MIFNTSNLSEGTASGALVAGVPNRKPFRYAVTLFGSKQLEVSASSVGVVSESLWVTASSSLKPLEIIKLPDEIVLSKSLPFDVFILPLISFVSAL